MIIKRKYIVQWDADLSVRYCSTSVILLLDSLILCTNIARRNRNSILYTWNSICCGYDYKRLDSKIKNYICE